MSVAEMIPDWLKDTTMGRKLVAEKTATALAERQGHVGDIARLRGEADQGRPALEKALADATRARQKAEAAVEKAVALERQAYGVLRSASHRATHAIHLHQCELAKTADPAIAHFIIELRGLFDPTRKMHATERSSVVGSDEFGRPVSEVSHWSRPSIAERLRAIPRAIAEAEALRLQAIEDMAGAIQTIRESIPSGTEMVPLEA